MNWVPTFVVKWNGNELERRFNDAINSLTPAMRAQAEIEANKLDANIKLMLDMKLHTRTGRLKKAFRPFVTQTVNELSFGVEVVSGEVNYIETQTQLTKEEGPDKTIYGRTHKLTIPIIPGLYGMKASEGDYGVVSHGGSAYLVNRHTGVMSFVLASAAIHRNRVPIYQLADKFKEDMPRVMAKVAKDAFMKRMKR